jgi:hypothetical protein
VTDARVKPAHDDRAWGDSNPTETRFSAADLKLLRRKMCARWAHVPRAAGQDLMVDMPEALVKVLEEAA